MSEQFQIGQKVRCVSKRAEGGLLYNLIGTIVRFDAFIRVQWNNDDYTRRYPSGVPMLSSELQPYYQTLQEEQEYWRRVEDQKRRAQHADRYL